MRGGKTSDSKIEQARVVKCIGERMRIARSLCNLSLSKAADLLGYSNAGRLSKVELATDSQSVPLWLLVRATKLYGVSLDYLCGLSDDFDYDARVSAEREVSPWLFDFWQKARHRDMAVLRKLNIRLEKIRNAQMLTADVSYDLTCTMEKFRQKNPTFDDMPCGNKLLTTVERMRETVQNTETELTKFQRECKLANADDLQKDLWEKSE